MLRRSFLAVLISCTFVVSARSAPPASTAVIIAGGMSDAELVALSVAVASAQPDADFLLDSPRADITTKPLFDRSKPGKLVLIGAFPRIATR